MPRPLRIHVPGAFYHVTLRGNHRQDIFFSAADRRLMDEITGEVLERFAARLHAYCWMTNHVHMLVQPGDEPLGRLILRIAGRYARTVQGHKQLRGVAVAQPRGEGARQVGRWGKNRCGYRIRRRREAQVSRGVGRGRKSRGVCRFSGS